MIDRNTTEKMAAMDWTGGFEQEAEEIDIDFAHESDASDGLTWAWNGTAWVAVRE